MSVGVGNRVNQYELQRIATSPERALLVNTLDDAIASIATVANATCLGKLTDETTCVNVFLENDILTYLPEFHLFTFSHSFFHVLTCLLFLLGIAMITAFLRE
jgi:hypothetical protein